MARKTETPAFHYLCTRCGQGQTSSPVPLEYEFCGCVVVPGAMQGHPLSRLYPSDMAKLHKASKLRRQAEGIEESVREAAAKRLEREMNHERL